jgi:hypothetical protein
MAIPTALSFSNIFSANLAGEHPMSYVSKMNDYVQNLTTIEKVIQEFAIKSDAEFQQAVELKEMLCSLSCYTTNNNLPENDKVWELESILAQKMSKWSKTKLAKPDDNLLIRYILWNKKYQGDTEDRKKIIDLLVEKGYIFRHSDEYHKDTIVVAGIECKVGDNTFTEDVNGRQHRQYLSVCVPQCFPLTWIQDEEYLESKRLVIKDRMFNITSMSDGKGCARYPKITKKDYRRLKQILNWN